LVKLAHHLLIKILLSRKKAMAASTSKIPFADTIVLSLGNWQNN